MRSHVQAKWEEPKRSSFGSLYKDSIEKVLERADDLWDDRIPLMIQAYFEDMEKILRLLYMNAKPNASLWLVVSTSAYVGVQIPVDLIIADIGERVGWYLREVHVLKYLRTSGQHWKKWAKEDEQKPRLRESVVIFDAAPKRT